MTRPARPRRETRTEEIARRFLAGESVWAIAFKLRSNERTIENHLRRALVPRKRDAK